VTSDRQFGPRKGTRRKTTSELRPDRGAEALAWAEGGLVCLFLALVGGVAQGWAGAVAGAAAGAGLGALWVGRHRSRMARRREAAAAPFPARWRSILAHRYDHYDRLPESLRPAFESQVQAFVADKRITGVGIAVTDELRVLVAASAATLSLAWDVYLWDQLAEVLLYARDFDRDYSFAGRELAGEAHPWGTIILSVPTLQQSFDDPDDGYHVGLHEFTHLLDKWGTHFEGILPGLDEAQSREWVALAGREMERMRRGQSVIDPYGQESPVEFLAVAVEAFFERPLALRRGHAEVYSMLRGYFGQDPAAWDEARGLVA
jgi:Mlc titration factor MtfA (ptsG expression regulator)